MKNKGLIITLIALLSIIIVLLVIFLVTVLNDGISFNSGFFRIGTKNNQVIFDESYLKDNISNLEIKAEAGDITLKTSIDDSIRVVVYGKDINDIQTTLYENTLIIDYTNYKQPWFIFGSYTNDIIVYVPQYYENEINIKNNYGNCTLENFEKATLYIDNDCGNIEIDKINNIKAKCDYGNIEIGTLLNRCNIESDYGNIKIENVEIQENSTIKSDLGNITINNINDIYVDASTDIGNTEIKNNNRNSNITLKVKADCGNINIGE